jgi:hypothetical protein
MPSLSSLRSFLAAFGVLASLGSGCVIPLSIGDGRGDGSGGVGSSGAGGGNGGIGSSMEGSGSTTAGSLADTTAAGTFTSTSPGTSEGGEVDDCPAPPEIPPPPVDCSEASVVLEGSVIIEDGGDDPSILEGVVEVTGAIRINTTDLTDLDFMGCVTTVGADVTIFGNDQLADIDGLWSLTAIGTDFVFSQNDALEDFDGLPSLVQLAGNIVIRENASLRTINGFQSLTSVDAITIQENPVLERIDGLVGLVEVGGFGLSDNPMLCPSSVMCVLEGIEELGSPPPELPENSC